MIGSGNDDDDDDSNTNNDRTKSNDTLLPLRHSSTTTTNNKHYPVSSSSLPGSSHSASSIGTSSYHAYNNDAGLWNRTKGRVQQYLTVRGLYLQPAARRSRKYAQKKREV